MPSADEHIKQIQSRVDVERVHLSVLDGQVKDPSLRHELQEAVQWLNDVEHTFLHSARQEASRPDDLARWFKYAEQALVWAIARRQELDEIVAKYGPDAETTAD
jgi:hypothetical protein